MGKLLFQDADLREVLKSVTVSSGMGFGHVGDCGIENARERDLMYCVLEERERVARQPEGTV